MSEDKVKEDAEVKVDLGICSTCRHKPVCGILGYDLRECAYYDTDADGDDDAG